MIPLPKKISPSPLLEAVAELRFQPKIPPDAVFGLVYNQLQSRFPKIEKLPILQLPDSIRNTDPKLVHTPWYKFDSSDGKETVQLNPRVISYLSTDYPGWVDYSARVREVLESIKLVNLFDRVDRLAIRAINFFKGIDILPNSTVTFKIREDDLTKNPSLMKTTTSEGNEFITLQITNDGVAQRKNEPPIKGSLIDIDAYCLAPTFDQNIPLIDSTMASLSRLHEKAKHQFFNVLDDKYLATLNPEY